MPRNQPRNTTATHRSNKPKYGLLVAAIANPSGPVSSSASPTQRENVASPHHLTSERHPCASSKDATSRASAPTAAIAMCHAPAVVATVPAESCAKGSSIRSPATAVTSSRTRPALVLRVAALRRHSATTMTTRARLYAR